ncbi:hypothetical protein J4216_05615 [Candidatus Woesearchaeota archaeon]|nr:hypothetical protein [Candidatus Woesearchaeota archaeon]
MRVGHRKRGLDSLVASLVALHQIELLIDQTFHRVPSKADLDDKLNNTTANTILLGRFYEVLGAALFNGRLPSEEEKIFYATEEEGIPDIIIESENKILESKSVNVYKLCEISGSQLEAYEEMNKREPYPKVGYVIWRHRIPGIRSSWKGTGRELIQQASKNTLYGIVLPLEVMQALCLQRYDVYNQNLVYVHPRDQVPEDCYNGGTGIYASTLTRLFETPEEILTELSFTEGVKIKRTLTPSDLRVERYKVSQFPLIEISVSPRISENDEVPF